MSSASAAAEQDGSHRLPFCVDPDRWAMIPYAAAESDAARRRPVADLRPWLRRQQLAHHLAVVEGVHHPVDLLTGLVALACDDDDVAGARKVERGGDRGPSVALLEDLGAVPRAGALEHRGADRAGCSRARVVVGHDDHVGEPRGELAHERPLAGVAVAAGAEDHDQPAVRERAQAREGGLDGVGLVRVVDDDRERLARVDPLEPARDPAARGDRRGDRPGVEPGLGRRRPRRPARWLR